MRLLRFILTNCFKSSLFLILMIGTIFTLQIANARVVENVIVNETTNSFEIKINFAFPMQYIGHIPPAEGDNLRIQFRINSMNNIDSENLRILTSKSDLVWDHSKAFSLQEMFWESADVSTPVLTLLFNRHAKFTVESVDDSRAIIIHVIHDDELKGDDLKQYEKYSGLLREAMAAFRGADYETTIRLLTKIEAEASGDIHKQALEYLGLARQRNNQVAHAKAEYEKFLKLYPEGEDAVRVRQRLAALITANQKERPNLRQAEAPIDVKEKGEWETSVYGSLSQFYFRDEINPKDSEKRTNVSNLTTNANLNVRSRNDDNEVRFQFVGSHQADFLEGRDNTKRLSRLLVDYQSLKYGAGIKIGRQSKSSGGVLGRFDGVDLNASATDDIKINAVFGHPVMSSRQTFIDSERKFYGASIAFENIVENWDFTTYFIEQKNNSLLDRRAIGGEVNYFNDGKSIFAMLDYDLHFKELNLAMINSNWIISPETTVFLNLDYRKSPLLTSTNAIQGQGVEKLSDLFTLYTEDEIYLIAADRTTVIKTLTAGVNQALNDKFRLSVDVTATDLAGTVSSAGVIGFPGTGTEIYTNIQLLGTGIFAENDSHIFGIRFNDRERDKTYGLYLNSRFRIGKLLRINPRLRLDYRKGKQIDTTRLIIRPTLKLDYRIIKWLSLEFEGGLEWRDETVLDLNQTSIGNYIYAGYRGIF